MLHIKVITYDRVRHACANADGGYYKWETNSPLKNEKNIWSQLRSFHDLYIIVIQIYFINSFAILTIRHSIAFSWRRLMLLTFASSAMIRSKWLQSFMDSWRVALFFHNHHWEENWISTMPFVSRLPDELSLNLKQLFTSSISNKAGKNTNYSNHITKSYCKTMNFIVTPNFSKKYKWRMKIYEWVILLSSYRTSRLRLKAITNNSRKNVRLVKFCKLFSFFMNRITLQKCISNIW